MTGTVVLRSGETCDLIDTGVDAGAPIRVGLGWTWRRRRSRPWEAFGFAPVYDTAARCLLLAADGALVDQVGFRWKGQRLGSGATANRSVVHSWGDLEGENEIDDDESVVVRPQDVPDEVQSLVFVVVSASGGSHTRLAGVTCRVWDELSRQNRLRTPVGDEDDTYADLLIRYDHDITESATGVVALRLDRCDGGWAATAVGDHVDHRSWSRWLDAARSPAASSAGSVDEMLELDVAYVDPARPGT